MFWLIESQVDWNRSGEDALAEQEHRSNDDRGDAGDQQAVLDGRGAALVAPAQQPGEELVLQALSGGLGVHGGSFEAVAVSLANQDSRPRA